MEEIISAVGDGLTWLAAGGLTYITALTSLQLYGDMVSERIHSFGQLQEIVEEEAKKLELTVPIQAYLTPFSGAEISTLRDGTIQLNLGRSDATRANVKHELYHLHKGHEHRGNPVLDFLDYFFRKEFVCTLYGAFGIKL